MKRSANVDLFRVSATLLVIMLHVLGRGGVLRAAAPDSANYWTAWFLEILAYGAVNCFALISGFVMVDKKPKKTRILSFWFQVLFYSLTISALCFYFFPETRTTEKIVYAFLPILGNQWWYASSYFILFFSMPLLNAAIQNISRETYKKILLFVLLVICVIDTIIPIDAFMLGDGYSFVWLMLVYLFGAYIKKYEVYKKITAIKSLIGFFGMVALTFMSKFLIHKFAQNASFEFIREDMLVSYTSITVLLSAVFLFFFSLNVRIGKFPARIIGAFAPVSLGVYLIHVHPTVFDRVIRNAFASLGQKSLILMILGIFAAVLAVFLICAIIEFLRILLFKLIRINGLCEFIARKFDSLYSKVFEK